MNKCGSRKAYCEGAPCGKNGFDDVSSDKPVENTRSSEALRVCGFDPFRCNISPDCTVASAFLFIAAKPKIRYYCDTAPMLSRSFCVSSRYAPSGNVSSR